MKDTKDATTIISDPDILKRVFGNLEINAVQAMPKGGKISIYAYRKEDGLVIEVQTPDGILAK
jgi:signal transduction histidine kinase